MQRYPPVPQRPKRGKDFVLVGVPVLVSPVWSDEEVPVRRPLPKGPHQPVQGPVPAYPGGARPFQPGPPPYRGGVPPYQQGVRPFQQGPSPYQRIPPPYQRGAQPPRREEPPPRHAARVVQKRQPSPPTHPPQRSRPAEEVLSDDYDIDVGPLPGESRACFQERIAEMNHSTFSGGGTDNGVSRRYTLWKASRAQPEEKARRESNFNYGDTTFFTSGEAGPDEDLIEEPAPTSVYQKMDYSIFGYSPEASTTEAANGKRESVYTSGGSLFQNPTGGKTSVLDDYLEDYVDFYVTDDEDDDDEDDVEALLRLKFRRTVTKRILSRRSSESDDYGSLLYPGSLFSAPSEANRLEESRAVTEDFKKKVMKKRSSDDHQTHRESISFFDNEAIERDAALPDIKHPRSGGSSPDKIESTADNESRRSSKTGKSRKSKKSKSDSTDEKNIMGILFKRPKSGKPDATTESSPHKKTSLQHQPYSLLGDLMGSAPTDKTSQPAILSSRENGGRK